MKLLSIETTPNPNSMKLNLEESLAPGVAITYTRESGTNCPEPIEKLLAIPGVTSVFQMADFLAIQRNPRVGWEGILSQARAILAGGAASDIPPKAEKGEGEHWGEVSVSVQYFRRIPMLVKVSSGANLLRVPLPDGFTEALKRAMGASKNMLLERTWRDEGVRYGDLREVGNAVVREISAMYTDKKLDALVEQAYHPDTGEPERARPSPEELGRRMDSPDWAERFAALEEIGRTASARIDPWALSLIIRATKDPKPAIRRAAVVYLGLVKTPEAVAPLCEALKDPAVGVRRSAGDALTDLGDPRAMGPMIETLKDPNKLVRWRAGRFLYELGDASALPALREAQNDPEFEVAMQLRHALERIESGRRAQGPLWQQMARDADGGT
jgi:hypothetical protein